MNSVTCERRIYDNKLNTHAHSHAQLILPIHGILHIETDYKKILIEDEHFAEDIDLKTLAAIEHYNTSYYSEWFKNKMKVSPEVESSSDSLWEEINDYCEILKKEIHIEDLTSLTNIKEGREVYKKLGKVPSKYRLSSEALVRRILQGKEIYKVNNIVEINNLISIKSKCPVGSYNIRNLHSPIFLTIGKEGEQYKGIGKENINIANLPVLADYLGSFGSPTSDSERAMITNNASEILMCIFSFTGKSDIEEYLEYGKQLLERYAKGKDIKTKIIE